ncbi:hypothetical protein [Candidatus Mycoplasma haematominutum]|nr:hypothetical protein [Candidatus Mycoplasma haematominutum]
MFLRLGLLGGGTVSIVLPALVATGFKDYEGQGAKTRQGSASSSGWASGGKKIKDWKKVDQRAKDIGRSYGIEVGSIPWRNKIDKKLEQKCKSTGDSSSGSTSDFEVGSQSWNIGRANWQTNKKLYGALEIKGKDKSCTLYLKWDGDSTTTKKGWYGRVVSA